MKKKKVLLVDGLNLLFRSFYNKERTLINSEGINILGVYEFTSQILKLHKLFNPYDIIVVFDSDFKNLENKTIDRFYKSKRTDYINLPDNENPFKSIPMIIRVLKHLKIKYFETWKYETDDIIASIAYRYQTNYSIIIVSTYKNFIQCINNSVRLYVPKGKIGKLINKTQIIDKYCIEPEEYVKYIALIGSKFLRIKGVYGVGKNKAIKLIHDNRNGNWYNNKALIESNIKKLELNKFAITKEFVLVGINKRLFNLRTAELLNELKILGKRNERVKL